MSLDVPVEIQSCANGNEADMASFPSGSVESLNQCRTHYDMHGVVSSRVDGAGEDVETLRPSPIAPVQSGGSSRPWISVSRRTGFRRLHLRGGCWYRAENTEEVDELSNVFYHAACKRCWGSQQEAEKFVVRLAQGEDSSVDTDDETSSSSARALSRRWSRRDAPELASTMPFKPSLPPPFSLSPTPKPTLKVKTGFEPIG